MGHPDRTPRGAGTAALAYAARGWAVFPLLPGRKEPATAHGFQDATTDPTQIKRWWRAMPDAGVGIATGPISGLVVVDCDTRHGGDAALDSLVAEGYKLPDSPVARTGGGGTHYYFATGGQVPTVLGLLPGVDLKAEGGYVVAPPSKHPSGTRYEWIVSPDMADCNPIPSWLLDMVQRHRHTRPTTLPESIPEGERNNTLFRLAAAMRSKGLSEAAILAALQAENATRCQVPLPDSELLSITRSASRYPPGTADHDGDGYHPTHRDDGPPDMLEAGRPNGGATIPDGWEVSPGGVWKLTYNQRTEDWERVRVAWGPVLIKGQFEDIDTAENRLELTFLKNGTWKSIIDFRDTFMDGRKVVATSRYGVPVISGTAGMFSRYLAEYEAANSHSISPSPITTSCGWKHLSNRQVFVLGQRVLGGGTPGAEQQAPLSFLPDSEGHLAGARSLTEAGTLTEWLEAVALVAAYPRVMFAVYTAFVPPLLSILGAPNFIVHLAGQTSRGKTATLEIAASVWGFPHREKGGLVQGWDTTRVHAERLAALFNHIPVFLDDSQTADRRSQGAILYMLANGVGRGRGSPRGLRVTPAWETVCLSTGEHPLAGAIQEGGARVRVLDLWGSPFGDIPVGSLVRDTVHCIRQVHGTAGPAFVQFLLANEEKWPDWRRQYIATAHDLAARFPGDAANIADRVAQYLAAVEVAGLLATEALDLPGGPVPQVVSGVMAELIGLDEGADYGARARSYTVSWAFSNRHSFDGQSTKEPAGGYLGRWVEGEHIAFFPHRLQEMLEKAGFDYEAVLRTWRERGWIQVDEGRLTAAMWAAGATQRMVVLRWDALEVQVGENETVSPENS